MAQRRAERMEEKKQERERETCCSCLIHRDHMKENAASHLTFLSGISPHGPAYPVLLP